MVYYREVAKGELMSLRTEWPCWEIMKCGQDKTCAAKENQHKLCWEIIQEVDSYSFNICKDCLVYISKQKDCKFTDEELLSIMAQKGVEVVCRQGCPHRQESGDE
jgi:hypothetical protein